MFYHLQLPVNLLRAGRVFVFEPPLGVRANLLRTFSTLPASRMSRAPNERARLYFLLAWFHAIVQERLVYAPLGWSKRYEFNESDLRCACDTIDTWIDTVSMGRNNLPPEKVPWDAIRTLLSQCIYGGKIDNEFDQRLMNAFVEKLFTARSFEAAWPLVSNADKQILMPDGTRREQFIQWSEALGDGQTPSWLGLPNTAEKVLLTSLGNEMIGKLLKMQLLEDDDELAYAPTDEPTVVDKEVDSRPSRMRILSTDLYEWSKMLSETLSPLRRTVDNIRDPLFRFFEREVNAGIELLSDVRRDLHDAIQICIGEKKQTNHHRLLLAALAKNIIPKMWQRYTIPPGTTVINWMIDFNERIKQLRAISDASQQNGTAALKNLHLWLGGMFIPEAYVTATRQFVAQANSWSLEELCLQIHVPESTESIKLDACSFGISGLRLQGAICKNNTLQLSSTITSELPVSSLTWIRYDSVKSSATRVTLPVYMNSARSELLFTVDFEISREGSGKDHSFYERGVAVTASTLGSP